MSDAARPQDQLQRFWDKRYSAPDYVYGTDANAFLVAHAGLLPAGGRVLCLADGEGRNGVWLAAQGFDVTSVDISPQGTAKTLQLAQARGVRLAAKTHDVTTMPLGQAQWDAVVSIFLHLPARARTALHRRVVQALKPGGLFVWEAYGPEQFGQGTGGPQELALLAPLAEVIEDFADCATEHLWTGWRDIHEGALHCGAGAVTQFITRKKKETTP